MPLFRHHPLAGEPGEPGPTVDRPRELDPVAEEQAVLDAILPQLETARRRAARRVDEARRYQSRVMRELREQGERGVDWQNLLGGAPHVYAREEAKLERLLEDPYFGRVIFENGGTGAVQDLQDYYVSRHGSFEDQSGQVRVVDWRSQAGARYYWRKPNGRGGRLRLVRSIEIDRRRVTRVDDRLERRPGVVMARGRSRLQEIIATLEADQFEIISSPARLLVVQGVPGSGKSEVALHRVAHRLYGQAARQAGRVLVVGPSATFLEYVSQVVQELGITQAERVPFQDLVVTLAGYPFGTFRDASVREWEMKGNLEYGDALERHLSLLAADWARRTGAIRVTLPEDLSPARRLLGARMARPDPGQAARSQVGAPGITVRFGRGTELGLSAEGVRRYLVEGAPERSLAERVEILVEAFVGEVEGLVEMASAPGRSLRGERRRLVEETRRQLESLRRVWPEPLEVYRAFLDGRFGRAAGSRPLSRADALALAYLALRINGPGGIREAQSGSGQTFDHVVVDEAQEIPPLGYRLLGLLASPGAAFTLVGDLHQRVGPGGLVSWNGLGRALHSPTPPQVHELTESYRLTPELAGLLQGILQRAGIKETTIDSRRDPGEGSVTFRRLTTESDWAAAVQDQVLRWRDEGFRRVAVICPEGEVDRLAWDLESLLQEALGDQAPDVVRAEDELFQPDVVAVITVEESKGLEFDAVVVTHADTIQYPRTAEAAHRLYVAASRTRSVVAFLHTHDRSPLLDEQTPGRSALAQ